MNIPSLFCIACGEVGRLIRKDFTTDESCGVVTVCPNVEMVKCDKCGDVIITPEGHRSVDSWITMARHLRIKDLENELKVKTHALEKAHTTIVLAYCFAEKFESLEKRNPEAEHLIADIRSTLAVVRPAICNQPPST